MEMKKRMQNQSFDMICADQSMRCPGFAQLHYDGTLRKASVVRMSYVDNKNKKKPHGQILSEIAKELRGYLDAYPDAVLIREKALAMVSIAAKTIQVLHKVIGVTDQYAWGCGKREFEELAPSTIKSIIAGNKDAAKEEVAAALDKYVGKQEYDVDDLSDAVATGIAWLIQKGYIKAEGK